MSRAWSYDDFVIRLGVRCGLGWEVAVEAHRRQGGGSFVPPFSPEQLQYLFELLEGRNLTPPLPGTGPTLTPRDAGQRLFAGLMQGEVLRLFEQSLVEARLRRRGLRLVVKADLRQADRAALLALPWELLYRSDDRRFLALSRRHSVVRFAELPEEPTGKAVSGLLRVLVAAACPEGLPRLAVEREIDQVRRALRGRWLTHADFLTDATIEAVREPLLSRRYHVLHFIGHGDYDETGGVGRVLFQDEDGAAEPVSGEELALHLGDVPSLGLVVLNACDTARAATGPAHNPFAGFATALVLGGVPRVLAMQEPITDRAAIAFCRAFYRRLAAGDPVDAASVEGRFAIVGANRQRALRFAVGTSQAMAETVVKRPEWAVPVLFLRADGALRQAWPRRRLAAGLFLLLALGAWLSSAMLGRGELRLHVGDFQVRGALSSADELTGASVRDALIQKLSAISSWPRIRLACVRCPELDAALSHGLDVDYSVRGELRLGERPEVAVEIYDSEALLVEQVLVRSSPGAGFDLLGLEQELTMAILNRLHVRLEPEAVAALIATPTRDTIALELNNEGAALLLAGDLQGAEGKLHAAFAADPAFAAAAANLAELEKQRSNHKAALASFRVAVERLPNYAVFHFQLGYFLLHGKPGELAAAAAMAVFSLKRAVELDPGYAEAYNELGNAFLELDQLGAARRAFEQAERLSPDRPEPHKNLARVAIAEGQPDEAIHHLDEALRRLPGADRLGRAEALTWLAKARELASERAAACRAVAEVSQLDPEAVSPWTQEATAAARAWACTPSAGPVTGVGP